MWGRNKEVRVASKLGHVALMAFRTPGRHAHPRLRLKRPLLTSGD
jgi:hypothetical protein